MPAKSKKTEKVAAEAVRKRKPGNIDDVRGAEGSRDIPIIGIGASAGGLEALETFFSNVPADSGMVFVVLQHFAPGHKSMMDNLLAKHTDMKIVTISEGMRIQPNTIYLPPSGHNVDIVENRFHLSEAADVRAENLPIDHFFRSLAESRAEKAICIVLSGTGSDGTQGLKAIKAAGGMAMAQDEAQAKYTGMPKSAIDTGLIDFVLPVEKMAENIAKYIHHPFISQARVVPTTGLQDSLKRVFTLIKSRTGHDFSEYKQTTIRRRIERRMAVNAIENLSDYVGHIERNPDELQSLFGDLLIGVTRFFRDPEAFESLAHKALGEVISGKRNESELRVWVVGCSTGEEAYSLAILLTELIEKSRKHINLQIFASDIDPRAIEFARKGIYPVGISEDVSLKRLDRFFTSVDGMYRIRKPIRDCVLFALQDITKDPPFSRIDLISCRNLLIYMEKDLQKKVFPTFHYSLIDKGILFLGTSETVGDFAGDFKSIDSRYKIYQKAGTMSALADQLRIRDHLPQIQPAPRTAKAEEPVRALGARLLIDQYTPPSVLVNERFEVRQFYGDVDRFLSLSSGEASLNVLQIARTGLRPKLTAALAQSLRDNTIVTTQGVRVKSAGEILTFDLVVQPLLEPGQAQRLILVVFREKERLRKAAAVNMKEKSFVKEERAGETEVLAQELKATKEYLQTTIEELQTTNEELRSTNEEMQSANEELESSREELQSTNEELVTVNSELQNKVEELTQTSNDLNNLLSSTDIATLFLDTELRIKRFTPTAVKIFRLQEGDIGRPIRDITSEIVSFNIYQAATDVLDTLVRKDVEVAAEGEKWFAVRILPYRTIDYTIQGVVLTFSEITELKNTLQKYKSVESLAEGIVDSIRIPFVVLDTDQKVYAANDPFYEFFKVHPEETIGRWIYDLGSGQWNIPVLRQALSEIIEKNSNLDNFIVEYDFPQIGYKKMILSGRRIEKSRFVYLSIIDATKQ